MPKGSFEEQVPCDGSDAVEIDVNNDGRPDIRHVMRQSVRYCTEIDLNFDGRNDVTRFTCPTSDAENRTSRFRFRRAIDVFSFYENGEVVRKELDTTLITESIGWLWCSDGWVSKAERARSSSGRVNVWYFQEGVLTSVAFDKDGDGRPDKWDLYQDGVFVKSGIRSRRRW
ncbi:MAG: hypothetical protein R3A47_06505 [Polyangiales bacterium]